VSVLFIPKPRGKTDTVSVNKISINNFLEKKEIKKKSPTEPNQSGTNYILTILEAI
jgi:hypothetical protein